MIEGVDSQYLGFQPASHEILAALSLYLTKFPRDERKLAQGLLAAVGKAPFLRRFINEETGQLTDQARTSLEELQKGEILAIEGDNFIILDSAKVRLNSQVRTYFKDPGIEALIEAAAAADKIWHPQ